MAPTSQPQPAYRTALFDLDGTLLDSIDLILESFRHTLRTHGVPAWTDEEILAGIGTPLVAQLTAWATDEVPLEVLVETYRAHNLEHHDAMVRPYPGIVEIVRGAHRRGVALGLVTSKKRVGAERGLRSLDLESCFGTVVSADDVTHGKPHPEPVLQAMAAVAADPASTLFVGDSVHDMRAGRAAGVATAAVLWGPFHRKLLEPTHPTHWIETPAELGRLVGVSLDD